MASRRSAQRKKQRFKGDVGVVSAAMSDTQYSADELKAPFPYFGGKRRIADMVWQRLGDVDTYNEPFAGSLAVLLGRPHAPKTETVNDIDCYLSNFWRALQAEPDAVAFYADWPVNEADLHSRHRWLVQKQRHVAERVITEPDFYDVRIAGYWVYGACLWIGSGWCDASTDKWKTRQQINQHGVHSGDARRWQGGGQGGGSGVHAPTLTQQVPLLRASASGMGVHATGRSEGLYDYLRRLAERLRRVRVCCGDWSRVLTPSVTTYIGTCGVFLDPPYQHDLRERCYAEDHDISADVREWAIANGDNQDFRIALCGYEDEHGPHMPSTWDCVKWKAHGGYSRTERGVENRAQERVWFSPHCLNEGPLFANLSTEATA